MRQATRERVRPLLPGKGEVHVFARLRDVALSDEIIDVAMVGSGFVARGLAHQLALTPGMRCAFIVARSPAKAKRLLENATGARDIVVSDDPDRLDSAVEARVPAITTTPDVLASMATIDVVVEATGDVGHGARTALASVAGGKHLVSLNYETDATVGPILNRMALARGVVYTGSDGDQPGVMMRLCEYVRGIGLDVAAAVNCKGFLDVHATPDTIRPWAESQGTSLLMTTAFTDGTKMNVENVSVANATGLVPSCRGMNGVETTLTDALADFEPVLDREEGIVEYTLGGDFGSGIFVIGTGAHPELAAPYLRYLKMGDGPRYLFFRPWHLVQFETPFSIADAYLDGKPTIAPVGGPLAQVVTIAKRDLEPGDRLDGVGGYDCYGEIDLLEDSSDLLPIGLAEHVVVTSPLNTDSPIALDDVEMDDDAPLLRLWRHQTDVFAADGADITAEDALAMWNENA